jgi:hypothetical protein
MTMPVNAIKDRVVQNFQLNASESVSLTTRR